MEKKGMEWWIKKKMHGSNVVERGGTPRIFFLTNLQDIMVKFVGARRCCSFPPLFFWDLKSSTSSWHPAIGIFWCPHLVHSMCRALSYVKRCMRCLWIRIFFIILAKRTPGQFAYLLTPKIFSIFGGIYAFNFKCYVPNQANDNQVHKKKSEAVESFMPIFR